MNPSICEEIDLYMQIILKDLYEKRELGTKYSKQDEKVVQKCNISDARIWFLFSH